jgi:hypothetical protein
MDLANSILQSFNQKKSLNPDIWTLDKNKNYRLRREVRDKLLLSADDFLNFVDLDNLDCDMDTQQCDIGDITITGSICNYNWSQYSDIDLHILIDFELIDENVGLVKNILNAKKNLWNASHDIQVKGYEVEVYAQDVDEVHHSSGVYSVLFDKWLVSPKKNSVDIDINKVLEKSEGWMEIIDSLQHQAYQKSPQEILDLVEKIKTKLKKFRATGLEKGGEYSYENLAFKFLRRSGYIKKLFDLKNKVLDLSLSLD